jgi:divalent metal cation (Fe/Co/Zn/Cd) transporter
VPGKISKEREELLRSREVRASTAISFIMILLGIGVVASSSYGLSNGAETEHEMQLVMAIALFSVFVFGTLTIIKFRYSQVLESESLFKDGLCSLIGTILAIALFVNSLIIRSNPSLWWLVRSICIFGMLIVTAVLGQIILLLIETVL